MPQIQKPDGTYCYVAPDTTALVKTIVACARDPKYTGLRSVDYYKRLSDLIDDYIEYRER